MGEGQGRRDSDRSRERRKERERRGSQSSREAVLHCGCKLYRQPDQWVAAAEQEESGWWITMRVL